MDIWDALPEPSWMGFECDWRLHKVTAPHPDTAQTSPVGSLRTEKPIRR